MLTKDFVVYYTWAIQIIALCIEMDISQTFTYFEICQITIIFIWVYASMTLK